MKHFAFLLFLSLPALLPAQSDCDYNKLYREGKAFAKKRQYKMALYKFNSARRCDPSKGEPVDAAIEALLDQIEGEKRTADRALAKAKKEQKKNEKIINAFYFYNNRFALAYKNGKYGFIDKEGNAVIPYEYDEALPFDRMGYARAKEIIKNREVNEFLIDTSGNKYPLASDFNEIDTATTMAIDFGYKVIKVIDNEIFKIKNLKVLILNNNELSSIPSRIGELANLQMIDLSYNNLQTLPGEIQSLKKLRWLVLNYNPISDEHLKGFRDTMPWCKIECNKFIKPSRHTGREKENSHPPPEDVP